MSRERIRLNDTRTRRKLIAPTSPLQPHKHVTLRRALTDPNLLGSIIGGNTWKAWRTLLIASVGEALTVDERTLFTQLTGRDHEPLVRVEELVGVVGRRGGKSRAIACLASYVAGLCDHSNLLAPGERGVALCICPDQRQAKIILDYAQAAFETSPIMRQLIAGRTLDTLSLTTGIDIEVRAASFRRLRGPTFVLVICDEAAFYYLQDDGSANNDTEILDAVRPGLATTNGMLAIISSPYAKRGELYELHKQHYGSQGDPLILVAQGASRDFNPTLPQGVVDRALKRDLEAASAEYLAQFRSDISGFVDRDVVMQCIDAGVKERPFVGGNKYICFTDPSGGTSDSFVCGIGHKDKEELVVDVIREIAAPFDPESAVEEFVKLFRQYGITETTGDRYSAQWCAQAFEKRKIKYNPSDQNKSNLYLELLPRLNAKTIKLLDHPRSVHQISMLERRTSRGGRDTVDHPVGAHDDCANVIAGLCGMAGKKSNYDATLSWVTNRNGPAHDYLGQRLVAYAQSGGRRF